MRYVPENWKPKLNDIVEIRALDHVRNDNRTYEFFVWGRVGKITRNDITVFVWSAVDTSTAVSRDEGTAEWFVIVKKAIKEIRRLG
jgi:hypothetical protein